MSAAVSPNIETFPVFPGTNVTSLDPVFVAAKTRVGEYFLTLKDGRKLCWFEDGPADGTPLLLFHGGAEGKYKFIQKAPIPGIRMISIDRPCYGGSSHVPVSYSFHDAADDIRQLTAHLKLDRFAVGGHSIGTCWAQQLAVALHDKVIGVILWATMIDMQHEEITSKIAEGASRPPSIMHPTEGWCGCILHSVFTGLIGKAAKYDFKDNVAAEMKCTQGWDEMKEDKFWISSLVTSLRANTDPDGIIGDACRTLFGKWPFDVRKITCPVYMFHGTKDSDMGSTYPVAPDFAKSLIKHASLEEIYGFGHIACVGPNNRTQSQIIKAVGAMTKSPTN